MNPPTSKPPTIHLLQRHGQWLGRSLGITSPLPVGLHAQVRVNGWCVDLMSGEARWIEATASDLMVTDNQGNNEHEREL